MRVPTGRVPDGARRRLLAAASLLASAVCAPGVRAAPPLPGAVRALDAAALALFEAAEAGDWTRAQAAVQRARQAATDIDAVEGAYTEAGGVLHRFYAARNALGGDLVEAQAALAARDRRWLAAVADRLLARAGELALPFAGGGDDLAARIETLLFLAQRMRRALLWEDPIGYRGAQRDFETLWKPLRAELAARADGARLKALDDALARAAHVQTPAAARALAAAVLALREAR